MIACWRRCWPFAGCGVGNSRFRQLRRQPTLHLVLEANKLNRLCQVAVHLGGQYTLILTAQCVGGQCDDRKPVAGFLAPNRRRQLVAIHERHVQVGEQKRIAPIAPKIQRLGTIVGNLGGVAEYVQLLENNHLVHRIVLGDQDKATLGARLGDTRRPCLDVMERAVVRSRRGHRRDADRACHTMRQITAPQHVAFKHDQVRSFRVCLPVRPALDEQYRQVCRYPCVVAAHVGEQGRFGADNHGRSCLTMQIQGYAPARRDRGDPGAGMPQVGGGPFGIPGVVLDEHAVYAAEVSGVGNRLPVRIFQRHCDGESGAFAQLAVDGDLAMQQIDHALADRQSQAGPAKATGGRRLGLGECVEEVLRSLRRHADAIVVDVKANA